MDRVKGRSIILLVMVTSIFIQSKSATIKTDPEKLVQTEKQLLKLLNAERTQEGLAPLASNQALKRLALNHCRKMMKEQTLSHDFPGYPSLAERMRKAELYFTEAGENVSFSNTFVASYIHNGFMKSPPHRARILDGTYTHCGISIVESAKGYWVTQEFALLYRLEEVMILEANINQVLRTTISGKGEFSRSFGSQYASYCRTAAKKVFLKEKIPPLPEGMGVYRILKFSGARSEDLLKDLKKTADTTSLVAFSTGIYHGRAQSFPGGGYSAFILMLPDLLARHRPARLMKYRVLKKINIIRTGHNLMPLVLSKEKSAQAERLSKKYYQRKDLLRPGRGVSASIHLTHEPEKISSQQMGFILSKRGARDLGLDLFYPPDHNLNGNYFLVTLVL